MDYEIPNPNLYVTLTPTGNLWSSTTYPWTMTLASETSIDSYIYQNSVGLLYNGNVIIAGQSFYNPSKSVLTTAQVHLKKGNFPTGTLTVRLYAHSGVFGVSSIPTGNYLDSVGLDVSGLNSFLTLKTFTFTKGVTMSANTYYCIAMAYNDSSSSLSDHVQYADQITSPAHAGNRFTSTDGTTFTPQTGQDITFYINGQLITNDPEKPWTYPQGY